jgi:hypothetical protein
MARKKKPSRSRLVHAICANMQTLPFLTFWSLFNKKTEPVLGVPCAQNCFRVQYQSHSAELCNIHVECTRCVLDICITAVRGWTQFVSITRRPLTRAVWVRQTVVDNTGKIGWCKSEGWHSLGSDTRDESRGGDRRGDTSRRGGRLGDTGGGGNRSGDTSGGGNRRGNTGGRSPKGWYKWGMTEGVIRVRVG